MRIKSDIISFRDVPLAIAVATGWFAALATTGYPVTEWVAVAMVGYGAVWAALQLVVNGIKFVLRSLHRRATALKDQLGIETPDGTELGFIGKIVVATLIVATFAIPIGIAINVTALIVGLIDLPPFDPMLTNAGIAIAVLGALPMTIFLVYSVALMSAVSKRLKHIETVAQEAPAPQNAPNRRAIRDTIKQGFQPLRELVLHQLPTIARARG